MSEQVKEKNEFSSSLASIDTFVEIAIRQIRDIWTGETITLREDEIESYTRRLKTIKTKVGAIQGVINHFEKLNELRKRI